MFRKGGMGVKPRTLKIYFCFLKRESKIELSDAPCPMCLGKLLPGQLLRGVSPGPGGQAASCTSGSRRACQRVEEAASTPDLTQRPPGICGGLGRWQAGGRAVGGLGGQLQPMLYLSKCPGTTDGEEKRLDTCIAFLFQNSILSGFKIGSEHFFS